MIVTIRPKPKQLFTKHCYFFLLSGLKNTVLASVGSLEKLLTKGLSVHLIHVPLHQLDLGDPSRS